MSEFDRLSEYRENTKLQEQGEIEVFEQEIDFPKKCLKCYKSGLRYCRFWIEDFCCEDVEEGEIEDIALKFVKREKMK